MHVAAQPLCAVEAEERYTAEWCGASILFIYDDITEKIMENQQDNKQNVKHMTCLQGKTGKIKSKQENEH